MQKIILIIAAVLLTACSARKYSTTPAGGDDNYLPVYVAEQVNAGKITSQPMVIIDGMIFSYSKNSIQNVRIRKEEIYSIDCIGKKDREAMARYGRAARGGAVIIVTKGEKEISDKPKEEQKILFLLGDRELTKEQVMKISPDDIEAITIVKGKEDVSKHTDKDYDGVIIIKLKEGREIPLQ